MLYATLSVCLSLQKNLIEIFYAVFFLLRTITAYFINKLFVFHLMLFMSWNVFSFWNFFLFNPLTLAILHGCQLTRVRLWRVVPHLLPYMQLMGFWNLGGTQICPPYEGPPYKKEGPTSSQGGDWNLPELRS